MIEASSFAPLMGPLGEELRARGFTVAVAESASGGLLAAMLTDLPGASEVFVGGFVTYTRRAKELALGVPPALLAEKGAVSAEVARHMAEAARLRLEADLGLSITGVAGPTSEEDKPVGLIYVGASVAGRTEARELRLGTGRASNRIGSVEAAVELGLHVLRATAPG